MTMTLGYIDRLALLVLFRHLFVLESGLAGPPGHGLFKKRTFLCIKVPLILHAPRIFGNPRMAPFL